MLDSHPDFAGINEFWEIHPYLAATEANCATLIDAIKSHLDVDLSDYESTGCVSLIAAMFDQLAQKREKQTGFLKDPRTTYFLDDWKEAFPDAKFVFIVRDPRAVVNSYLQQGLCSNAFCGAELWEAETTLQEQFQDRHPDVSWSLRYEDLIEAPETKLREMCEFLETEFSDGMMDYHKQPAHTTINPQNIETQKPIKKGNRDKWRSSLTTRQIRIIDATLAEAMRRFGYQPDSSPQRIGAFRKRLLRAHNRFAQEYRWQKQSNWKGVRRRLPSWIPGSTKPVARAT